MRGKLKRAGWDTAFLANLNAQFASPKCDRPDQLGYPGLQRSLSCSSLDVGEHKKEKYSERHETAIAVS
jgi:hypothetical protein